MQRLAGLVDLVPAFCEPVFQVHVVLGAAALVDVQLVGGVDRNRLLHIAEQLLEVDDVAVVLVVAIQTIGAADGLKQVVVAQRVVEVDVAAARGVEAGEQFADHDQQFEVGRLLLEAALHLVFVLLGGLPLGKHVPGVGVELVAFVAVLGLARDRVVVRLERRDDPAVGAERLGLEDAEVVARVVDARGH